MWQVECLNEYSYEQGQETTPSSLPLSVALPSPSLGPLMRGAQDGFPRSLFYSSAFVFDATGRPRSHT